MSFSQQQLIAGYSENNWVSKMAQCVEAPVTKTDDPSLIPRIHIMKEEN